MRVLTTALPLLLSSMVVKGHMHAHANPARHNELADKRQDDASDDTVLGGIFAGAGDIAVRADKHKKL